MKETSVLVGRLKFIILSLLGIYLFLVPITITNSEGKEQTSLPVASLANKALDILGGSAGLIIMLLISFSAIMTVIFSTIYSTSTKRSIVNELFNVNWIWVVIRVLGAIFVICTYFKVGPAAVINENTGLMVYNDLLPTLLAVFFFAGLFLPLLMDFGLLEFLGPMFAPIMRPVFKLPGRSTVDNLASFIGDGTVGVMITSQQYEQGFYTRREATVIATTFSVVSITFAIVIAQTIGLMDYFFKFYLSVIIACIVAAFIMPRIWPLKQIPDKYSNGSTEQLNESIPKTHNPISWGFEQATQKAVKSPGFKQFIINGVKTVLDMWLAVLPVVMTIGTLATIVAEYTPTFSILGAPFVPLLELMQIPYAKEASETLLIGFADMFLPSLLISDVPSDMTRFIVGALSISQLIYLSEVGGVILGSKIPVSLGKLFMIYIMRTIIALPIIVILAHIFF
ncbi:YjiH family protein [Mammaliicoccus sciuri]|jgi:nucleoside recognition membrane protein YjiH|uniref:YjiH family protein n=1 Tax=Mammaliicoccus sciuri TaxID=1296 RepID=UPI000807705D|nr:YjiH family protein [Mammaliicoccus sciuri]MBF0775036.1 YjiH family protein [Mammaliicoccus sciuri]MBG9206742.1 YjiH family protein [Mammaliicoccus sciuri]MCC2088972.1 YjiH family protein [Mammaliicoccus sciuri]MCD8772141.1 YjiH family protein [Mammaliicoccus sciuri]MCD8885205.1 YjiH family protein [Mammaliicoccus sciuri]